LIIFSFFLVQASLLLSPQKVQRSLRNQLNKIYAKLTLSVLNIKIQVFGSYKSCEKNRGVRRVIVVANHLSWLDPLVLMSLVPCRFVTSSDVKRHPFLGPVSFLAGCFFVTRNFLSVGQELESMQKHPGERLAFFPEATSGDGRGVKPFKSSLYQLGMDAKTSLKPVVFLPVCLRYVSVSGHPFGDANRDIVCWYGDMGFFRSLIRLMSQKEIRVEVEFANPVVADTFASRKDLCQNTESVIRELYTTS
jgi:1-acyl-sn-glycerol-3-phosphate acyltransferase